MSDTNSLMDKLGDLLQLEVEALIKERDTLRTRCAELEKELLYRTTALEEEWAERCNKLEQVVEKAQVALELIREGCNGPRGICDDCNHHYSIAGIALDSLAKVKGGEDE